MEIKLIRIADRENYTIGRMYINGRYFCDTLEPANRGLDSSMSEDEIRQKKRKGPTAIPYGEYMVLITKSIRFNKWLPLVYGVKGFSGIRIHAGNEPKDTRGCILPGENVQVGCVDYSRNYMYVLMKKMQAAYDHDEKVMLTITHK